MAFRRSAARCIFVLVCCAAHLAAQELQPRAYAPAPVGSNYFGIAYSTTGGGLLFDPSLPVENTHVNANIVTLSFGQSLGVLGRTAQALISFPYVSANLSGLLSGAQDHLYRSGPSDVTMRYAMNIFGAPAMRLDEFASYHQGTIVGASITMTAPSGQYDPNKVINIGANRWSFKPELGFSRAIGKWTLEGAVGVWLYTANNRFEGSTQLTQMPLGSVQTHVVRTLPHRSWVSLDWTLYGGGRTNIGGRDVANYQENTRWGATYCIGLRPRHTIKISFFEGSLTRVGADIHSIGISYNIVWQKGAIAR